MKIFRGKQELLNVTCYSPVMQFNYFAHISNLNRPKGNGIHNQIFDVRLERLFSL